MQAEQGKTGNMKNTSLSNSSSNRGVSPVFGAMIANVTIFFKFNSLDLFTEGYEKCFEENMLLLSLKIFRLDSRPNTVICNSTFEENLTRDNVQRYATT
jgi:hypothetical protein